MQKIRRGQALLRSVGHGHPASILPYQGYFGVAETNRK